MIELIKFELGKIFSKKSVWILIVVTIFSALNGIFYNFTAIMPKEVDTVKEQRKMLAIYQGQIITKEGIENVKKESKELRKKESKEELTGMEYLKANIIPLDYILKINPTYLIDNDVYNVYDMKKEMNKLEKEGNTDTFEYKNIKYIHDLASKKEDPRFYFKPAWHSIISFDSTAIFLSTLVALGVATIFSNDYQSNSASIVLSSKNGKNKLVKAKVISALVFSAIIFSFINFLYLIYGIEDSFKGCNLPLNFLANYENTPLNVSLTEFYIIGFVIGLIGIILFTLLTILISLVVKNNMMATLITLGIYYIPNFIADFMPTKMLYKIFKELNISKLMEVEFMFKHTNTYNIFGNPVLYSNLLITIALISIPIVLYMAVHFGKRQTI